MRGDIRKARRAALELWGSPPRARGHRSPGLRVGSRWGLTPACAGTSRLFEVVAPTVPWLTPACAGTSPPKPCPPPTRPAHPRVRGDIPDRDGRLVVGKGSPPRARGHPVPDEAALRGRGLTPACAGTSTARNRDGNAGRAHPRVRGDIDTYLYNGRPTWGSPPRARGHPARRRRRRREGGLTPACAGTSGRPARGAAGWRAHPRVRGDVSENPWRRHLQKGSPPRARGRRRCLGQRPAPPGLTPACAGTSHSGWWTGSAARAHPRVRGDVSPPDRHTVKLQGSPPRARGRRSSTQSRRPRCGLTPACAGTSSGPTGCPRR